MSFQSFCDAAKVIDKQIIDVNDAIVINFFNKTGKKFSTDPNEIVMCLKYILKNHDECILTITSDSNFDSNKTYLNYKEDPYRALYKWLSSESSLGGIATLGGSQTSALTSVIAKFVCYLSGSDYQRIQDNTFLDKPSITTALSNLPENMPENMNELVGFVSKMKHSLDMKGHFKLWLVNKGLSEKSVRSYSGSCIAEADKLISAEEISKFEFYQVTSLNEAIKRKEVLDSNPEWQKKNTSGNGMYDAGIKNYLDFLREYNFMVKLPKPFLLLAGISGTGKTRFVREQAREHNVGSDNFCLVPVRPDWHEPSDLLGYVSRIGAKPEYVSTKVLQFIIQAWCVIAPNADANGMGEINLTSPPYWLCLDEMNLAPVEQYFADYLSVLESRKFEDGKYTCDPLLDEFVLKTNGADVQSDLGLMDNESLWQYFKNYGIPIPPNLIVAGTVNMDETTHGFSRKVIDRALTIDFGEFFPNDYSKIFGEQNTPKTFTYSLHSQITREAINCQADPAGDKTIAFLQSVNDVLKDTPFELAYRALNELLLHVCSFAPDDDAGLQAVWDDFLMTKILPRIDGDDDKLRVLHGDSQDNLLVKLNEVISKKLSDIWDADKGRIDLFREQHDGTPINDISCRSKKKIRWMINRLERNTFTSYWP
jgi:hypothetical protein